MMWALFVWYLYIIECRDGSFYTGITQDVKRRLKEHRRKGSHFTGYNPLKKLLYVEEFSDRPSAKKREAQIKRWSRAKKLALISGDFELLKRL